MKTRWMALALLFFALLLASAAAQPSPPAPRRPQPRPGGVPPFPGNAPKVATRVPSAIPVFPRDMESVRSGQTVFGNLAPGESYQSQGVTLTWKMKPEDRQTSEPLGYLEVKGAHTPAQHLVIYRVGDELTNPRPPQPRSFSGQSIYLERTSLGFYLEVAKDSQSKTPAGSGSIGYNLRPQPDTFKLSAGDFNREFIFVSALNPVTLGSLELSVSKDVVPYPDGTKSYQLRVLNKETKEAVTLQAKQGITRRVGRLDIGIKEFYEKTQTAYLELSASEPDLRPQGGDSYVTDLNVAKDEPIGDFFARLAQRYQFSVEWVENPPGNRDSVEYAKNLKILMSDQITRRILSEALPGILSPPSYGYPEKIGLEWTDATHLRVWAKDYEKIVAQKEAEAKKAAEANAAEEARVKELAQFKEKFNKDYGVSLRPFPLHKLSPSTARTLVEPELTTIYLINGSLLLTSGGMVKVLEKGEYYAIVSVGAGSIDAFEKWANKTGSNMILARSRETVVADDRANAVIVSAAAPTQRKVAMIVAEMDAVLEKSNAPGVPKQYRIEAILLQGAKAEPAAKKEDKGTSVTGAALGNYMPQDKVVQYKGKEYERYTWKNENNTLHIQYLEKERVPQGHYFTDLPYFPEATYILESVIPTPINVWPTNNTTTRAQSYMGVTFTWRIQRGEAEKTKADGLKSPQEYGISPEDLKVIGLDRVRELGRGVITLAGEKGEIGKAILTLSENYRFQLEFQDVRAPYLIVKGSLTADKPDKPLISNTLFLERDKPTLLGVTNLKEALILLVKQTN